MTERTDAVVVGSGAGGGVVAKELGEAGLSVVVIEAGPRYQLSDYPGDRQDFEARTRGFFSLGREQDRTTSSEDPGFDVNRAKGVGGSTLRYQGVSPRFHESDFRVRTLEGVADDWPLRYEDLEPHYTRVEYELGVAGTDVGPFGPPRSRPYPTAPHPLNCAARAVKRGADRLGLHLEPPPLAIPTESWDGRPACRGAGACSLGCWWGAKSSIDVTYVRKAEATGNVEIRSRCMARKIVTREDGRADGVVYIDPDGEDRRVRGRVVVVAGSAIETPRLLLLSASGRSPDGLGNSSGLVGRRLMEHVGTRTQIRFPRRVDPWKGPSALGVLEDHYRTPSDGNHVRGFTVELAGDWTWPLQTADEVGGWGAEHRRDVHELFGRFLTLNAVGEQLPDEKNRVELDPEVTDNFGLPVPRITYRLGANDRAIIESSARVHRELAEAAGAEIRSQHPHRPGGSAHYMGTCRMGTDPTGSVVDPWGASHDVPNLFIADGSVFVTGAAANPALTISALATRTSRAIVGRMRRGEFP